MSTKPRLLALVAVPLVVLAGCWSGDGTTHEDDRAPTGPEAKSPADRSTDETDAGLHDKAENQRAMQRFLDDCNSLYTCSNAGKDALGIAVLPRDSGLPTERMRRSSEACHAAHLYMTEVGKAYYLDYPHNEARHDVTWTLDGTAFEVCEGAQCIHCTVLSENNASSDGGAHCTGSATSCSGLGAGFCASQDGCSGHTHYDSFGYGTFECEGTARSCSTYDAKSSCEKQSGCSWR